jgi:hypothetical protein
MTTLAVDAEPGKVYRLTREPGTTYYKICDPAAVRRLYDRLSQKNPRTMKPADLYAWMALGRVRESGHILAVRVLRFRGEDGRPKETRAYVAFPPDYALREVERPPGYGQKRGRRPSAEGLDKAPPSHENGRDR